MLEKYLSIYYYFKDKVAEIVTIVRNHHVHYFSN